MTDRHASAVRVSVGVWVAARALVAPTVCDSQLVVIRGFRA